MTDTTTFAKRSQAEELWNVTLLPLPARSAGPATKALENLDVRRSDGEIVRLPTSFESQLKAAGW